MANENCLEGIQCPNCGNDDRFHWCALAAGYIAASEGRLDDALYVRELAYSMYEEGAFRDRVEQAPSETVVAG